MIIIKSFKVIRRWNNDHKVSLCIIGKPTPRSQQILLHRKNPHSSIQVASLQLCLSSSKVFLPIVKKKFRVLNANFAYFC